MGAGAAGSAAAEALRQEGYTGRIVMVGEEDSAPYDRIKYSKNMAAAPEEVQLRLPKFYEDIGVEMRLGQRVR